MLYLGCTERWSKQVIALMTLALVCLSPKAAVAQSRHVRTFDTARFTLHIAPTRTSQASTATGANDIAAHSFDVLNSTSDELSRIFEDTPRQKVVLRFLSPEDFRKHTGAPAWTSAMYFRDEISIPLPPQGPVNLTELRRALRHEYVHAFIAELSSHRCPAWLDEGVAQLIEGHPNPLLGPALRRWISRHEAMPLDWLHNGFTTLENDIVPAAYAQSLFATRSLVNSLGFNAIKDYLKLLRSGAEENFAFENAFGTTKRDFENQITAQMQRWAESNQINP